MRNFWPVIFLLLMISAAACKEKGYPKPKELISEKEMVDVLCDIHLAEALANRTRYKTIDSIKMESKDLYQAALDKHGLNDSILAMSVIYYSARPKVYEKIYTKVVEQLNLQIEGAKQKQELKIQHTEK